jgi:uncharacterized protein YbjT (DUF2867 family)/uncharacterized protein YndB with AHSA1/START domain
VEPVDHPATVRVLLVGPSSYLGRRLLPRLLDDPRVALRVLATSRKVLGEAAGRVPDLVEGDPTDPRVLLRAAEGIDVAFYPIGFVAVDAEFDRLSRGFPARFRDACIEAGVRRIIYLGARLGTATDAALPTLGSAGAILSDRPDLIQTIWFHAEFILGSGSMLFEALRHLVQKLPLVPVPRWMETPISAIGVRDVLDYLLCAVHAPLEGSIEVPIGLDPLRFRDMLSATASAMGLRRVIVPVPVRAERLSPYLLMLLTPFSTRMAGLFIEMMETETETAAGSSTETARRVFPDVVPAPFEVAVGRAIAAIEQEQVVSRWTDSMGIGFRSNVEEEMAESVFRDVRRESFGAVPPEQVFRAVSSIGGRQGWFRFTPLWRIRALMDKLAGGFGDTVGRRTDTELRVGDLLDVWRVIDFEPNRRLLLAAHMKTFGKAWLEFRIEGDTLVQTAYHYPKGLMGRLYWYSMLPFHAFIFPDMVRGIIREATDRS